jgi:hypothetical protein
MDPVPYDPIPASAFQPPFVPGSNPCFSCPLMFAGKFAGAIFVPLTGVGVVVAAGPAAAALICEIPGALSSPIAMARISYGIQAASNSAAIPTLPPVAVSTAQVVRTAITQPSVGTAASAIQARTAAVTQLSRTAQQAAKNNPRIGRPGISGTPMALTPAAGLTSGSATCDPCQR